MKNHLYLSLITMLIFLASCRQKTHTHLVSSSDSSKKTVVVKNGSLAGKKYLYDFNTSYYEIDIQNDSILNWRCIAGTNKGKHGTRRYYKHDIGRGVVMVGWTGEDKITVSQVINFNTDSVKTFITRQGKTIADQGRVEDVTDTPSGTDSPLQNEKAVATIK
ncbi:MAG: hypothetical protein INR69_02810 [Mucilaginibacter polytrichastri]|nr:hypothetical protein [Mucilaginibacter polytrichastri]